MKKMIQFSNIRQQKLENSN